MTDSEHNITLADLIRKGGSFREQITGKLFGEHDSVCALGAAIRGAQDAGLIDKDDA